MDILCLTNSFGTLMDSHPEALNTWVNMPYPTSSGLTKFHLVQFIGCPVHSIYNFEFNRSYF